MVLTSNVARNGKSEETTQCMSSIAGRPRLQIKMGQLVLMTIVRLPRLFDGSALPAPLMHNSKTLFNNMTPCVVTKILRFDE